MAEKLTKEMLAQLAEPFDVSQVRWKPQVITDSGNALAVAYVDPRVVCERLDQVVGGDWSFHWEPMGQQGDRLVIKSVITICGVTREDVGEYVLSDRSQTDPWKSAVSDALKRAAVLFGVGRYLYWLDPIWCSYDRKRRQFIEEPYLDEEGNASVRRQSSGQRAGGRSKARSDAGRPRSNGNGRRTKIREAATDIDEAADARQSAEDAPWKGDFFSWAAKFLEHQSLSSSQVADIYQWLKEEGLMMENLDDYDALNAAQAAFMKGLPTYLQRAS